jgi:putative copper resistance protein D
VGWLVEAEIYLLAMIVLTAGVDAYGRRQKDPFAERNLAQFILLLLLLDALVQAGFDVTLAQGGGIQPWLLRWLHLAAFALWFGGAVWNIFITVPAARGIVSLPVVVAASQQLERFRVVVRLILPTLIITGFIQAYRYVGFNLTALTASTFGWLILTKILLIGVLIIVFLTCPMWRACSPISGMCKLDDLYAREHE